MNKEQQELLDEAYKNYRNKKGSYIYEGPGGIPTIYTPLYINGEPQLLTKEEFIYDCKTDLEFSEKWGLKIEERELSLEERIRMYALKEGQTYEEFVTNWDTDEQWSEDLSDTTIPTRLITITHNDKTIESYE